MRPLLFSLVAMLLFGAQAAWTYEARPSGAIFPSGDSVPENLLHIEVQLSSPLGSPPEINHVRLYDSQDREIKDAFLDELLLSSDGQRVTVLLDPARVKSGVAANLVAGRALHAGTTVTLVVDDPRLSRTIRKSWKVSPFNAESPLPVLWSLTHPRVGSKDPLTLRLNSPISEASAHMVAVRDPAGNAFSGTAALENNETVWLFKPSQSWRIGPYAIVVRPELEDPEGNRPCGSFETIAASQLRCDDEIVIEFRAT